MSVVEFGEVPDPINYTNKELYDKIIGELQARPGHWGKCAEVVGYKAVQRWAAAMRKRGAAFKQRLVRPNTWAVWCMWPENND